MRSSYAMMAVSVTVAFMRRYPLAIYGFRATRQFVDKRLFISCRPCLRKGPLCSLFNIKLIQVEDIFQIRIPESTDIPEI